MPAASYLKSAERERLAARMFEYYRSNEEYFDYVHDDAGEQRPNEEEREMYRVIARTYQRRTPDETTRVLELGCGRAKSIGALLTLLGKHKFTGLEASVAAVREARKEHPDYDLQNGDITNMPFGEASFDIVTLNYVLEHLPAPFRVMDEIMRVLRPGGLVGMIVPVCDLPWALPRSLRYRIGNMPFTAAYTARRWLQQMKLRYSPEFFEFEVLQDPQVLVNPDAEFEYDDDLVYNGSSREITKYLRRKGCRIVSAAGRDIKPYIRSGRRLPVDVLRTLAFAAFRASLCDFSEKKYTTTVSVVARKEE